MNEDLYAWIEDYNLGRLASPKLEQFEAAIATDAALAAAVRTQRLEWEVSELLAENLLREQIRQTFQHLPTQRKNRVLKKWRWFALPLLLLMAIAGFFLVRNKPGSTPADPDLPAAPLPTNPLPKADTPDHMPAHPLPTAPPTVADHDAQAELQQIALAAYHVPDGLFATRGAQTADDTLSLASRALAQKKYQRVLQLLDTLPAYEAQKALLLRAHAHFGAGQFAAAVQDFTSLEAGGIYRREAQWFGLLARIALPGSERSEWMKDLDAIRQQPKHPYQRDAGVLWEKLNRMDR